MAFKYTNKNNVSMPLAVWLMHDDYDYDKRDNVISATSLPNPAPIIAAVGFNISGIPGPPLGPT